MQGESGGSQGTDAGREPSLRGAKLLLAEDNTETRECLVFMLQEEGAQVDTAIDGIQAVDKARGCRFDLILMDLTMPKLDGISAMRAIRLSGCEAPIIALTARPRGEAQSLVGPGEFNAVVMKPFEIETLLQRLTSCLPGAA